jgi:hypothetical protein
VFPQKGRSTPYGHFCAAPGSGGLPPKRASHHFLRDIGRASCNNGCAKVKNGEREAGNAKICTAESRVPKTKPTCQKSSMKTRNGMHCAAALLELSRNAPRGSAPPNFAERHPHGMHSAVALLDRSRSANGMEAGASTRSFNANRMEAEPQSGASTAYGIAREPQRSLHGGNLSVSRIVRPNASEASIANPGRERSAASQNLASPLPPSFDSRSGYPSTERARPPVASESTTAAAL